MKKLIFIMTMVLGLRSSLFCSEPCKKSANSVQCYADWAVTADQKLNDIYKKVTDDIARNTDQSYTKGSLEKLKEAQRAWVKFRDAHCSFETDNQEMSVHARDMVGDGCAARMSEERTKYLEGLLEATH